MKGDANSRTSLQIIGNHLMQAAARGDTAGMLEHLAVYLAALKASGKQKERAGD